jgi:LysM repeat protein
MKKIFFVGIALLALGYMSFAKSNVSVKHTVKKGETLFSISKNYGVKVNDLLKANPGLGTTSIHPGQQLHIPAHAASAKPAVVPASIAHKPVSVPSTPETPYREEDSKVRKTTESTTAVNAEQPLIKKPGAEVLRTTSGNAADYASIYNQYSTDGFKPKKNKGAANALDENTSGNQYLALYNDAESGSVIKVTNLMSKKVVYVKVVGRVSSTDAGKEVMLKLSKRAAIDLGATDEKFLVEVVGFGGN